MRSVIQQIKEKHLEQGIDVHPPVTASEIRTFERCVGFRLPDDFREFYAICNGFYCNEDLFRTIPLNEALDFKQDYGKNWFYFSEYMIYSDTWGVRILGNNDYQIFNGSWETVLTSSLEEFLNRFLKGNVFQNGGLYSWHDEPGKQSI